MGLTGVTGLTEDHPEVSILITGSVTHATLVVEGAPIVGTNRLVLHVATPVVAGAVRHPFGIQLTFTIEGAFEVVARICTRSAAEEKERENVERGGG